MGVRYTHFDGYEVSLEWAAALQAARNDGVAFTLTDGHRTMAMQMARWNKWHGIHPVAWPTPTAPHIRIGSPRHAIDVDETDGGATRLVDWLNRHGAKVSRPVGGEPWHIDPADLGNFPFARVLRGGMRGPDVKTLVDELQWLEYLPWPILGRPKSYYGGWVNTAVAHFQADYHLPQDGTAGAKTAAAIKKAIAARKRAGAKPKRRPPLIR